MKTLPVEYRHRVIALTADGLTSSESAEILDVSAQWVRSIKKLHASGEPMEPKSRALNGDRFRKYVHQELAPQLRSGDIFVWDNLPTHEVSGVVEAVPARDARVLYLPPDSPDFNPIEQVFSKSKNELRRRELRTIDALENAFGESLDWITKTDALHYFQNSGYAKQRN